MKQLSSALLLAVSLMVGCSWGGEDEGSNFNPPIPDASVSAVVCGDSVCAASEIGVCTQDCGSGGGSGSSTVVCGNNVCDAGETNSSCPNDCTGGGSGSNANCPSDPTECLLCAFEASLCMGGLTQELCTECALGGLGSGGLPGGGLPGGSGCNFDMVCDAGEDATTCVTDCP